MKKTKSCLTRGGVFLMSILLAGCHSSTESVCLGKNCVQAEVMTTPEELEKGLMGRTSLAQNQGMLFVFPQTTDAQMWMKNMRFPIDILWISSDYQGFFAVQNVPACTTTVCPIYKAPQEARYVLELPAGFLKSQDIVLPVKVSLGARLTS